MISVVILTHNRLPMLRACVESIRANDFPDYEIVIVDNASTDGTPEYAGRLAGARVVRFEENMDLATSRNAGIDAARGDIIAFTDDDCVVERDWLARIAAALARRDAVGGVVKLGSDVRKPRWWDEELNWMPGLSVPGLSGPLGGEVYLPQSANLAYRADVLRRLRFREGVGGIGARNMTREDSDLWARTRSGGFRTSIDTGLVVYHMLPARRFTLRFCIGRAFSDGYAAYFREDGAASWREKLRFVARRPFDILRRLLRGGDRPRAIEYFWVVRQAGFVFAHLREHCPLRGLGSHLARALAGIKGALSCAAVIVTEGVCLAAIRIGNRLSDRDGRGTPRRP
ncbi:MAG: glycosyltransferase family 2 protein [bacterium]|nr:glycosyltransferase family 2 protein [bacterium]